jgi:putative nucleotidyltransferase with HDIG domain
MITREDAWQLLTEFTKSESLIHHALAVEAAMRAYAQKFGEDEEKWGAVGLIHDFDYEKFPTFPEHTTEGAKIMRERNWPGETIRAMQSHANYSGVPRESLMEKALYASDELTGLITAVALVRPSKDIRDITKIKSIKKKFKDRSFAAAVSREEIAEGAEALGVDLWTEHVPLVLEAMKGIAEELGLAGQTNS